MPTRAPSSPQKPRRPAPHGRPVPARPLHFDRYGLRAPVAPAIALVDGDGLLLQVSAGFAELLQLDRLSLQGSRVEELLPAEDWHALRRAFANLREGLDPVAALSARFITREQRARRCLTALYALRRRDGSLESLLLALQPVGPPAGVMLARPALLSAV
jgi:PAS domain-containing protein